MDTRFKFVSLLTLILLASLFTSLFPVSQARPLFNLLPCKDGVNSEANHGVFRTLKSSGPSPGVGHRHKKLQILGGVKNSGPSPGKGHEYKVIGVITRSVPSPGQGHKHMISNNQNQS
ncbi:hypothetical protein RJT34_25380 [Clitoria ternatea]|uniref:Transmembrane protein n=1 Tax=Clitoria ternatea TaxID=43366 RepID=A0AAN9FPN3_CLITE